MMLCSYPDVSYSYDFLLFFFFFFFFLGGGGGRGGSKFHEFCILLSALNDIVCLHSFK